jgi:mycofactocin precursor
MSQSAADAETEETATEVATDADAEADEPTIEEDLFEEELKIDGICGVY